MASMSTIAVIDTVISVLSVTFRELPVPSNKAKVTYIIGNDGANDGINGILKHAGGQMPDLRMFNKTIKFLSITVDPKSCGEGETDCFTEVNTKEAVTYTLFTGNDDAVCIAWAGLTWAGGQKMYGFHPGNWAYVCDQAGYPSGSWHYAGTPAPGMDFEEDVYCLWVDRNGDFDTTGFQVHWPEFDGDTAEPRDLDYYCSSNVPFNFRTRHEPNNIYYNPRKRNMFASDPSDEMSRPVPAENKSQDAANGQSQRVSKRSVMDSRIIKSHFKKHLASELCDPTKGAAGPSFVSYAEELFCYMPTKTLFPFCKDDGEDRVCWSDVDNKVVVAPGVSAELSVPDLGDITETVVWGNKSST